MVKKHKRYTAKTTGRMIIVFVFFGAIITIMSYTLVFNLKRIGDMKNQLSDLDKRKVSLLEEEDAKRADIKRLSDPLYIARYAREKHFFSKENEIILIMDE